MYLINASSKKIKNIMVFLKQKGVEYEESKSNEYLVVRENPKDILPAFLMAGVKVIEASMKEAVKMYKNYGAVTALLRKKSPVPEEGQAVRVIGGEYKDLHLSGRVISVGQKGCVVEVIAWGNLVRVNAGFDDIEIIDMETF